MPLRAPPCVHYGYLFWCLLSYSSGLALLSALVLRLCLWWKVIPPRVGKAMISSQPSHLQLGVGHSAKNAKIKRIWSEIQKVGPGGHFRPCVWGLEPKTSQSIPKKPVWHPSAPEGGVGRTHIKRWHGYDIISGSHHSGNYFPGQAIMENSHSAHN